MGAGEYTKYAEAEKARTRRRRAEDPEYREWCIAYNRAYRQRQKERKLERLARVRPPTGFIDCEGRYHCGY